MSILDHFTDYNLGIDFGTSNTRIIAQGKGLVIKEPTVIARQRRKGISSRPLSSEGTSGGQIIAVGKKAKMMIGKQPHQIEIIEPIAGGVIVDFDSALSLISHFFSLIKQLPGKWFKFFGPKVIIGVYSGSTEVERRAVKAMLLKAGAREVFLVERPMAAAIGLDLPVERSGGIMLVDIGGGSTEIAVISLGGIVLNRSLSLGGKQMDEAIGSYLRMRYGILVGSLTSEKVKIELGCVFQTKEGSAKKMVVRGRDLESGLPKSICVNRQEVMEAILPIAQKIMSEIGHLLEELPAELINDILKRGIGLTGGVSQISGFDRLVSEETKMPVWLDESPGSVIVKGCERLLENQLLLDRVKLVSGLK